MTILEITLVSNGFLDWSLKRQAYSHAIWDKNLCSILGLIFDNIDVYKQPQIIAELPILATIQNQSADEGRISLPVPYFFVYSTNMSNHCKKHM